MTTLVFTPQNGKLTTDMLSVIQQFGDATADFHNAEQDKLMAENPGMTASCAMDVSYLRTRSRWSPKLEERLIREHRRKTYHDL